jgi:hypothetical protein
MTLQQSREIQRKFSEGMKLTLQRLIERAKKEDGELVISRNGKIVHIKAKDL